MARYTKDGPGLSKVIWPWLGLVCSGPMGKVVYFFLGLAGATKNFTYFLPSFAKNYSDFAQNCSKNYQKFLGFLLVFCVSNPNLARNCLSNLKKFTRKNSCFLGTQVNPKLCQLSINVFARVSPVFFHAKWQRFGNFGLSWDV